MGAYWNIALRQPVYVDDFSVKALPDLLEPTAIHLVCEQLDGSMQKKVLEKYLLKL